MKLVYLSDQRYYFDDAGRWYTAGSLPLAELMQAAAGFDQWVLFGRLCPVADAAARLWRIEIPAGLRVEFAGPRHPVSGLHGYLRWLREYRGLAVQAAKDADLIWAKLSFLASLLVLSTSRLRGRVITQLIGDPGDTIELRGGLGWRAVAIAVRAWNRRVMTRADTCLFVSDALRRKYLPHGQRGQVIHEGRIQHTDLAAQWRPRPACPPQVLYVGRLSHEKAIDVLIRAVAEVKNQMPVRLRLVGAGPQADALAALARDLGVSDCVEFSGQVAWGPDLFAAMRAATCLTLPSLTEGLPLVLLEAMSQATPVIASDVGGIPELVEHDRNGLLVRPGDATALAAALVRLLPDMGLQQRLATEGLRDAAENTLESQNLRLRLVFEEITQRRAA